MEAVREPPSEANVYADIEAAWNELHTRFAVDASRVVLYGRSIGSVPSIHLATLHKFAGVVLHAGLLSGIRVFFPRIKRTLCCDPFRK